MLAARGHHANSRHHYDTTLVSAMSITPVFRLPYLLLQHQLNINNIIRR